MKLSISDKLVKVFAYAIIGFFAIICLYPLIMVVSVSFSSNTVVLKNGYSVLPQAPTLETYQYLFAHSGVRILKSYAVTIFTTVVGTVLAMIMTSMIAFALSIKSLKYRILRDISMSGCSGIKTIQCLQRMYRTIILRNIIPGMIMQRYQM